MIELLQKFIQEDSRFNFLFNIDNYTYVIYPYYILRTPKLKDLPIPDGKSLPDLSGYLPYFTLKEGEIPQPLEINIPKAEERKCPVCEGLRLVEQCCECKGNLSVTLSNEYSRYEVKCKTCNAEGYTPSKNSTLYCPKCHSNGKIYPNIDTIKIDQSLFCTDHLIRIKETFSNCKIITRGENLALITFDNGEGIMLPLKT